MGRYRLREMFGHDKTKDGISAAQQQQQYHQHQQQFQQFIQDQQPQQQQLHKQLQQQDHLQHATASKPAELIYQSFEYGATGTPQFIGSAAGAQQNSAEFTSKIKMYQQQQQACSASKLQLQQQQQQSQENDYNRVSRVPPVGPKRTRLSMLGGGSSMPREQYEQDNKADGGPLPPSLLSGLPPGVSMLGPRGSLAQHAYIIPTLTSQPMVLGRGVQAGGIDQSSEMAAKRPRLAVPPLVRSVGGHSGHSELAIDTSINVKKVQFCILTSKRICILK
jgi:hypothetical protein